MRSTNRMRSLAVSGAVVLLCMTIIVGMTWALFTDTEKLDNHLQAGDLDITLKRIGLTKTVLNSTGYLDRNKVIQTGANPPVDFTNTSTFSYDKNVFDIKEDEVIVPGSEYTATMRIENHSDVAFGYWIEIVCTDSVNGVDLSDQVYVTVDSVKANDNVPAKVSAGLKVGSETDFINVLGTKKDPNAAEDFNSDTFTVTVHFKDEGFKFENGVLSSDNDSAMNENIKFDLIVYAVQVTDAQ